jgi:crotonyl-CoA carboxylase/reductase
MSEAFPWAEIPEAHMKMWRNEHLPGNMAVLVSAAKPGMTTLDEAIEAGAAL